MASIFLMTLAFNGHAAQDYNSSRSNNSSITVEDLVIDEREMTTGADWDYFIYDEEDARREIITIRARVKAMSTQLRARLDAMKKGKNIRKSISLVLKKSLDRAPAYVIRPLECSIPVSAKRDG